MPIISDIYLVNQMILRLSKKMRLFSYLKTLNYDSLSGLSNEIKSKLKKIRPDTLGQA